MASSCLHGAACLAQVRQLFEDSRVGPQGQNLCSGLGFNALAHSTWRSSKYSPKKLILQYAEHAWWRKTWVFPVPLNTLWLARALPRAELNYATLCNIYGTTFSRIHFMSNSMVLSTCLHFLLTQTCPSYMQRCSEASLEANHFYCDCAIMRDEDLRTEVSEVWDFAWFFFIHKIWSIFNRPRGISGPWTMCSFIFVDLHINLHIA